MSSEMFITLYVVSCFFIFCTIFFWRLFLLIERLVGSLIAYYSNTSRLVKLEQTTTQLLAFASTYSFQVNLASLRLKLHFHSDFLLLLGVSFRQFMLILIERPH